MISLNVFDANLNRLGIIDTYEDLDFTLKYYDHSLLFAIIEANKQNIAYFITDAEELRILTKSDDVERGYIVDNVEFRDDSQTQIVILAKSMSSILGWRSIRGQQVFKGNIEAVLKSFVNANAINPVNPNRVIPNLALGADRGLMITTDESYNNKPLDESLWEICQKFEVSYEVLLNHTTKKFDFVVFAGEDRSTLQEINPRIIFSKSFGNVIAQSYMDDKSNYKSTAYVAGEGEGIARKVITIKDEASGYDRREVFFDARDLQSTYTNTAGTEVTIPPAEYEALLIKRGQNRIADYQRIQTFTNDADSTSQYVYGRDYFLGDKTTSRNDELGLIIHSRVVVVKENYSSKGYTLKIEFGTAIPTLFEKLKKAVK